MTAESHLYDNLLNRNPHISNTRDKNMPSNKSKQPRRPRERKSSTTKAEERKAEEADKINMPQERTGNEDFNKDIFVDIEPRHSSTKLIVAEPKENLPTPVTQEQQVLAQPPVTRDNGLNASSDHTVINVEQDSQQQQQQQSDQEQATKHNQQESSPSPPPQESQSLLEPKTPLSLDSSSGVDDDVFDEAAMSATLTRLTTPNGAEIYLIGTAHFSLQSVHDVRKVIRSVKPTSVLLELCRERGVMLTLDEQYLFEQNSKLSFKTMRDAMAEKGLVQGLIFVLFIKMSASLTEKLGMAPGAEFRAGSAEAQKVPGCNLVLADRSLRTTIARAVAALSAWQKLKLTYMVLRSDLTITQDEVEKCKDRDILEQLMLELGGQFPGFKRVLLDERDVYLSHSIYRWAQNCETSLGPPRIVAIMGIGHVPGIVANWGRTTDEQIRDLNIIPETSRTELVVRKTVKYGILALFVYLGYRCLTPSSVQTAVSRKIFG